jgi:hypothetical protein
MTANTPRFSMKKRFIAPVAVMATIPAALALALPAQAAGAGNEPCTPSAGTEAAFGEWTPSDKFTDWQESAETPVDPDGQANDDNPLNLMQIGEHQQTEVPGGPGVETSSWVREQPTGDGWSIKEQKTFTDKSAYDETVSQAVDQWYHWNGSFQNTAPAPPPAGGWGMDNGAHNGLMNKPDYAPNKVFDASVKGGKNASWFFHGFREAVILHHDAVSHIEYRYERQVQRPGHTEYRWSIEQRTFTPAEQAVECTPTEEPTDGPTEEPTDEPTDELGNPGNPGNPGTPSVPTEVKGQTAAITTAQPSTPNTQSHPTQSHAPVHNAPAVPLSIDAGL